MIQFWGFELTKNFPQPLKKISRFLTFVSLIPIRIFNPRANRTWDGRDFAISKHFYAVPRCTIGQKSATPTFDPVFNSFPPKRPTCALGFFIQFELDVGNLYSAHNIKNIAGWYFANFFNEFSKPFRATFSGLVPTPEKNFRFSDRIVRLDFFPVLTVPAMCRCNVPLYEMC